MKKLLNSIRRTALRVAAIALTLVGICALTACSGDDWKPTGNEIVFLGADTPKYICVFADGDDTARTAAVSFSSAMIERGLPLVNGTDTAANTYDEEIIFGAANRKASEVAAKFLKENSKNSDNLHWVFYYREGDLAIVASGPEAYAIAQQKFIDKYYKDGKVSFADSLKEYGTMSRADYNSWVAEQDKLAADALKAERDALLAELMPLYTAQRDEIAADKLLGVATPNIGNPKSTWTAKPATPIDEHPRLFLNASDIPGIKAALEEDTATNERFLSLLNSNVRNDGKCGAVTKDFQDRNGLHNYDKSILEHIQVKALGYLVEGHDLYGYQAIYAMKNFLLTLDIQYISSDQCREYGNVMFTAAIVYDWCYDLLTEEDKAQLIAGVETRAASGNCGDPSYTTNSNYKKKMEVGFPPSGQGALAGHGAEGQILRNYLAAAVAFYGDNNSWWNYVAARVYNDYIPIRNYYFQSGISQQGTGLYIGARHTADIFSAWIIKKATGDTPYKGIDQTVRNFLGYECAPGALFTDGDGTYETKSYSVVLHMAYMTAYLFEDAEILAWAEDIRGSGSFGAETSYLTSALYVALRGLSDVEPAENRYKGMDLIQYNGHPVGQYIIREAWNSNDSAAAFMKIKELNTGNHEHCDAGTFEIYYKGMLTSDGGCYNTYGTPQTAYFHKATISHNGLIIFDASKWDYNSSSAEKKWYSGGQNAPGSPGTLSAWLSSEESKTGTVTGRQHAYSDDAETKPLYAYIAGDITAAYPSNTVEYVGRRMLTVYTGDEEYPMVFFVYDDITSDNKTFEKRFLLQISSKTAPTVDEKKRTIVTENGEGRLVLTCLTEDVSFRLAGGRNTGSYSAEKSMNYCINGYQCLPKSNSADDKHWGRVEIYSSPKSASRDATFMNVLYVTDKGNENMANVRATSSDDGLTGGIFDRSIVALFATSRDRADSTISCKTFGSDSMSYYVSGVAAGKWTVTVGGNTVGTYEATADGGLLTFTAPAGEITIFPAK